MGKMKDFLLYGSGVLFGWWVVGALRHSLDWTDVPASLIFAAIVGYIGSLIEAKKAKTEN